VYRLRDYDRADFGKVLKLDQECFPEGIAYDRQELYHYLTRPGVIAIVAEEEGGELGGFIVVNRTRAGGAHVITIDVAAEHRRHGLGSKLMALAEIKLMRLACPLIQLEVAIDNKPAIHFYKRHGYSVIKTLPRYYLNSVDALVMLKDLPKAAIS
jgi:ribosomal protein S18 acetylase RimI-like enzyme